MQATSSQFTALVQGQSMTVEHRVSITLPGGIYPDVSLAVESVTIDESMTTDMPAGARLAAGYSARTAQIALSGLVDQSDASKTAAWLFAPYSLTSPLYREKIRGSVVTVDIGLYTSAGVELVRKFTGTVDGYTVQGGQVVLSCVDGRNGLRTVADIPAAAVAPPYNQGLTSEYAVDALLRAASRTALSSWPQRQPGCVFAAGFRTSLAPDVGSLSDSFNAPALFGPGVFGTALADDPTQPGTGSQTEVSYITGGTAACSGTVLIECWATLGTNAGSKVIVSIDGIATLVATRTAISVFVGPTNVAYTWTTPISGTHYFAVMLAQSVGSTSATATLYIDGASSTSGTLTTSTAMPANVIGYEVDISLFYGGTQIEAVQVAVGSGVAPSYPFTPTAVIDPSLNALQVIPDMSGDPWQVIQQIADAEQAVAGFDELGVFRFRNRRNLQTSPVQRAITATASLESLQSQIQTASAVNHVTAQVNSWAFGAVGTLWTASTVMSVAPGKSKVTVDAGSLFAGLLPFMLPLTQGTNPAVFPGNYGYFRASLDPAGRKEAVGAVTFTILQTGPQQFTIQILNYTYGYVYLVSPASYTDMPAGTPSLWIGAQLVTPAAGTVADSQWPPVAEGGAPANVDGEIALPQISSPFLQDPASGQSLTDDLLSDLARDRAMFTNVSIVCDPRLQLGDRVILDATGDNPNDPNSGLSEHVYIWGQHYQLSNSGWSQTVDARAIGAPGGWLLGVTGRSELASTTYL